VLALAFIIEGYSFIVALKEFLLAMRRDGVSNPIRYLAASKDPTLIAVVLEDSVAMLGLVFAITGIGLSAITGNALWDVGFSALIAVMLGCIAFYLGVVNMRFLADMRDQRAEAAFVQVVNRHAEVERYYDLRSIVLDEGNTVLVAEIELREEAIVTGLSTLIDQQVEEMMDQIPQHRQALPELKRYLDTRAAVQSTLERTEQIIAELEIELQEMAPQVTHVTIEVKGITGGVMP
jgi:divalent metal cation (Fe/Co/Zn/Cd) transporter